MSDPFLRVVANRHPRFGLRRASWPGMYELLDRTCRIPVIAHGDIDFVRRAFEKRAT